MADFLPPVTGDRVTAGRVTASGAIAALYQLCAVVDEVAQRVAVLEAGTGPPPPAKHDYLMPHGIGGQCPPNCPGRDEVPAPSPAMALAELQRRIDDLVLSAGGAVRPLAGKILAAKILELCVEYADRQADAVAASLAVGQSLRDHLVGRLQAEIGPLLAQAPGAGAMLAHAIAIVRGERPRAAPVDCPGCGGSGDDDMDPSMFCPMCGGEKTVTPAEAKAVTDQWQRYGRPSLPGADQGLTRHVSVDEVAASLAEAWRVLANHDLDASGRTVSDVAGYIHDEWAKLTRRALRGFAESNPRPSEWPWQQREFDQFWRPPAADPVVAAEHSAVVSSSLVDRLPRRQTPPTSTGEVPRLQYARAACPGCEGEVPLALAATGPLGRAGLYSVQAGSGDLVLIAQTR